MQVLVSTCSNGYLSTNNYFASTDAQDKYGRYLAETDHNMFVLASTFQIILVSRLRVSVPTKHLIGTKFSSERATFSMHFVLLDFSTLFSNYFYLFYIKFTIINVMHWKSTEKVEKMHWKCCALSKIELQKYGASGTKYY